MPVISVSQLNNYMKRYIEQNIHLSDLWVKAEVSNLKLHYSGHIYLTLKDEYSSIKAIMFKAVARKLLFDLNDGMKVLAYGKLGVYERDGVYQLYIESITPDGVGELYAMYEKLKKDLSDEGLFDSKYKIPIPRFPKKIGIITSSAGAALKDIINVISRRYNMTQLCIYPVKVQGIGSAESICDALDYFSSDESCDVIILARGGGSIEDLWSFNEEKTARAIFRCKKPVVTGVGHETDYTISDFVADLRAPTPSAAAELCTPSIDDLYMQIRHLQNSMNICTNEYFQRKALLLDKYSKINLIRLTDNLYKKYEYRLNIANKCLASTFTEKYSSILSNLNALSASLNMLNPHKVLGRGYSMVLDENNNVCKIKDLHNDMIINVLMDKGQALCRVLEVVHEQK